MKSVLLKMEDIQEIIYKINMLEVSGVGNARIIARIGDILEGGQIVELNDSEKEGEENGNTE